MVKPATLVFLVTASFVGGYFTHKKLLQVVGMERINNAVKALEDELTPEEGEMLARVTELLKDTILSQKGKSHD